MALPLPSNVHGNAYSVMLILNRKKNCRKVALRLVVFFGLVAAFDPGVTLLPAMYSSTNGTDHRKLDTG